MGKQPTCCGPVGKRKERKLLQHGKGSREACALPNFELRYLKANYVQQKVFGRILQGKMGRWFISAFALIVISGSVLMTSIVLQQFHEPAVRLYFLRVARVPPDT
jgi:hypothetical protein